MLYNCPEDDGEDSISSVRPRNDELTFFSASQRIQSKDPAVFPPFVYGPSVKQRYRFCIDLVPKSAGTRGPYSPKQVIWSSRQYSDHGARDQQELKGNGLVTSWKPRNRETLTAKSVAEITYEILAVISSGELGTKVSNIDRNLAKFRQYAAIWGAIILIDKADVFLEAEGRVSLAVLSRMVAL